MQRQSPAISRKSLAALRVKLRQAATVIIAKQRCRPVRPGYVHQVIEQCR